MTWPRLLVFLRHGLAVPAPEFDGADADRPLTAKGLERTLQIAQALVAHVPPTRILSSPLVRAEATARLVAHAAREPAMTAETSDALSPETTFKAWCELLTRLTPALTAEDVVVAVGHEPSLGALVAAHLGLPAPLPMKKAGVAILEVTEAPHAQLLAFVPPSMWRRR